MRITRLSLRGIGPYREPVDIDLDAIPGRLVAVTGRNGEGKTALVESLFLGALDRTTTVRGGLIDVAIDRDSALESAWETDHGAYVIRHLVDGVARKGESLVTNGTGEPVLADTKVSTFDEWRRAHFPPSDVIAATLLGVQGDNGYLSWPQVRRRDVVSKALQIDGLEQLAERAREAARDTKARRDSLSDAVARERERAVSEDEATSVLVEAREHAAAGDRDVEIARRALTDAKARHADLVAAWENAQAASEKRAVALLRVSEAEAEVSRVSARLQSAEQTLADADRVRTAAARLDTVRPDIDRLREERREAQARLAETRQALANIDREVELAGEAYAAAKSRADAGEDARRDLQQARCAAAGIEEKRARVTDLERIRDAAAAECGRLYARHGSGKDERITLLRSGLVEIRDTADDAVAVAGRTLDADDAAARSDAEQRAALRAADERQSTTHREHLEAFFALQEQEKSAARIPDLEKTVAAANEAEAEMNKARARQEHATNGRRDVELRRQVQESKVADLSQQIDELDREVAELAPVAARLQDIAAAEARLEEIRGAEITAEAALVEAKRALDACPEPPDTEPVPDVSAQEQAVESAERAAREAHAAVAVAEKGLEDARAAAARIASLESEVKALDVALSDWTRLGQDLGRTGLQAMLLDAAAPELTALTNDILHRSFGPRYTVEFTTTKPSADGKKTLEVYDVTVIDTETGYAGPATGLSGGQRVIVGTAIRFALATVAGRQSGFTPGTMVIDEGGAALDQHGAAAAWIHMVGVAAESLGVDKVLVVSHDSTVIERCDAVIEVGDGRAAVAA